MFCPKCNGCILTIEQMNHNLLCDICQERITKAEKEQEGESDGR